MTAKHKRIDWQAQRRRSRTAYLARMEADSKRRFGKRTTEYFDPQGRAIDMWRWTELSYSKKGGQRVYWSKWKRVQLTITPRHRISTVWLGLNHGWMPGEKIIFESMVFCTHDEAEAKRDANMKSFSRDSEKVVNGEMSMEEFGESPYPEIGCAIDQDQWRYSTKKQALKGHWRVVNQVRHYERGLPSTFDSQEGELDE